MGKVKRRELKKAALKNLKKHYWLLICVCLIAAILGTEFNYTLRFLSLPSQVAKVMEGEETDISVTPATATYFGMDQVYQALLDDQEDAYKQEVQENQADKDVQIGQLQIGHENGVLASAVDMVSNGMIYMVIFDAFKSLTGSRDLGLIFFMLAALLVFAFVYIFIVTVYNVVMARIFLEVRVYDNVPIGRFAYLLRVKRWIKVSFAMFRKSLYMFLWDLTIVGGIIKAFSYFCVPFILAENPDCSGKDAILLSRKMMNGHKWECFVFELTFLLWDLLNFCTAGLAGLFFVNAYKTNAFAEYYAYLRQLWIDNKGEGRELFNDKYLYKKADQELLKMTYADVFELRKIPVEKPQSRNKVANFFAKNFGLILKHDEEEIQYLRAITIQQKITQGTLILDGKMYPARLSAIPESEKDKNMEEIGYLRTYTLVSVILIFFAMCIIGWLWEESLHIIASGSYVKRGVLHGPWLPVYGSGGVAIMLLLNRCRKNPALHLVMGMVVSGIIEYCTAWYLEIAFDGQKWWDYSGYFLNLHGRVCAEGLLVFGFAGMAMVYIIGPALDNIFRKIPYKIAVPICVVLVLCFLGDVKYSSKHPNTGKGVTDTTADAGSVITTADIEIPVSIDVEALGHM